MGPRRHLLQLAYSKGENIMSNALTTRTAYRPGLLGRSVFDDVFDNFFVDFPQHLRKTTSGYPVADIYRNDSGDTVLEFALAGFVKYTKRPLRIMILLGFISTFHE